MSIMPLLPTRLVSNLCFRIYTKKGVGVIHLCSSRRSSLACFQVTNEKHAEAHAYMATSLVPLEAQWESCLYTQASTAASHDLAIELRVRASIKALVNAYSNIYVRWFICQPDSLLDVAKIRKICHYEYGFPEKR